MSIKTDKLLQRLTELQKFVSERSVVAMEQSTDYPAILSALERLEATLKQGKLVMQLVGEDPAQVQALQKLLKSHSTLASQYHFKIAALPQCSSLDRSESPGLILQPAPDAAADPPIRYPLGLHAQVMGRHPDAQLRLPDRLSLVSGRHAEIRPAASMPQGNPTPSTWQICDLNSRNGTYVNGERVHTYHPLQPGDSITLGAAKPMPGAATFRLQIPQSAPASEETAHREWDADILCLVVAADQPLTDSAQQFLLQSSSCAIRMLVAALPGQKDERIAANLTSLADWIDRQTDRQTDRHIAAQSPVTLVPLLLDRTTTANATVLSPQSQPEFEQVCQLLATAAANSASQPAALIERINASLTQQISQIEQALSAESAALKQHLQIAAEPKTLDALKEKSQKAIAEARDEKDKVFKQIKQDLSQARAAILDSFSRKSILHQIQSFTDALHPTVLREGNYRRIHLHNDSMGKDVQQEMHGLCRTVLVGWAKAEWQRINMLYADHGLTGLNQRVQQTLREATPFQLDWVQAGPPDFDPQPILDSSIVEPNFETRYRGDSMKDYFMKQMRAPLMQYTFLSGAIIGLGTVVLQFLKNILHGGSQGSPAANASTPSPTNSFLNFNSLPSDWKTPLAFLVVFLCISGLMYFFYSLNVSYQREEEFKREDAIAKIKKDLSNYYQSLAKSLVERLAQSMNTLLETEDQKLTKAIDRIAEQFKLQITDAKVNLDSYNKQLQKLQEAKLKLEKLKSN